MRKRSRRRRNGLVVPTPGADWGGPAHPTEADDSVMQVWIVDAFSDRPFTGNPAGVCLLESSTWPGASWMRTVAGELNWETAFVRVLDEATGRVWGLRWFTPWAEANLCGHATLATAHVLHGARLLDGPFRFHSPAGLLVADALEDGCIRLDFPAAVVTEVALPRGLSEALGRQPVSAFRTGTLGDLLVTVEEDTDVLEARPNSGATVDLCRRESVRGVVITAPAQRSNCAYDFVSRYFAPGNGGLYEDAVTGSAHTALAPYWARQLGRKVLTGLQASARAGSVHTELHGDRVYLTGFAVTTMEGVMTCPGLSSTWLVEPHD